MDNIDGSPITPDEVNQEPTPAETPETPVSEVVTPEPATTTNEAPVSAEKKKSKAPIILTIILLVLICGGVVAFFLLKDQIFGKKSGNDGREEPPVAEIPSGSNALGDFDLAFLKQNNTEENKIYSPLSIKYALKMLSDGAKGETKAEIDKLIGDYEAKSYTNNKNRSFANALFVQTGQKSNMIDSYISGLKSNYGAEVVYDNFTSATNINKWISDKTMGIIKNMLNDEDVATLDFALINALAIDMSWNYRLQCANYRGDDANKAYHGGFWHEKYDNNVTCVTDEYDFDEIEFGKSKTKVKTAKVAASVNRYDIIKELGKDKIRSTVKTEYEKWLKENDLTDDKMDEFLDEYMEQLGSNYGEVNDSTDFKMYVDDDVKVFAKNLKEYDGTTLQYVGIMPRTKDLKTFVSDSSAEDIANLVAKAYDIKKDYFKEGVITKIVGNIPFFKYDYKLELIDDLKELGVNKVFNAKEADLSGLTSAKDTAITAVKHKADIEFSNDGIKAAAVTVEGGAGAGIYFEYDFDVPVETIDITFDQPYMYLIRDIKTGEVWFTGTVYAPQTELKLQKKDLQ